MFVCLFVCLFLIIVSNPIIIKLLVKFKLLYIVFEHVYFSIWFNGYSFFSYIYVYVYIYLYIYSAGYLIYWLQPQIHTWMPQLYHQIYVIKLQCIYYSYEARSWLGNFGAYWFIVPIMNLNFPRSSTPCCTNHFR